MTEEQEKRIEQLETKLSQTMSSLAQRYQSQSDILKRLALVESYCESLQWANKQLQEAHRNALEYIQLPWYKKIFKRSK